MSLYKFFLGRPKFWANSTGLLNKLLKYMTPHFIILLLYIHICEHEVLLC